MKSQDYYHPSYVKTKFGYGVIEKGTFIEGETVPSGKYAVILCQLNPKIHKDSVRELVESDTISIEYGNDIRMYCYPKE